MNNETGTTPKKVSQSIKLFLRNMGMVTTPRMLPFTKVTEQYKPMFCFDNCEEEVRKRGGQIVYGWTIWEIKKLSFLEAEFHAVISRNNKLIDVTPRVDGEKKILFVPDNTREAIRYDDNTWDTWTPFKAIRGHLVEVARPILRRVDPDIEEEYSSWEVVYPPKKS